jgi:predicted nucleic acid-binding protein
MTAVTNTGPLIALAKLNHLHLLPALYGRLIVPRSVYRESIRVGQARGYTDADIIESFLDERRWLPVEPSSVPAVLVGDVRLGQGEIEAIALASEQHALLLIDDVYARGMAEQVGIETVGTLGVLVQAYRQGNLARDVLTELLTAIEKRHDIWIHPTLCKRVRSQVLQE